MKLKVLFHVKPKNRKIVSCGTFRRNALLFVDEGGVRCRRGRKWVARGTGGLFGKGGACDLGELAG